VLIGLFYRAKNETVGFMPAPDFLEAGKFKVQRGFRSQMIGSDLVDDATLAN
jgi:hypothetical protein